MAKGRAGRAKRLRRARRLSPALRNALEEDERISAEQMMPDETIAMLNRVPVDEARDAVRRFMRGMEIRGYWPMANLAEYFERGEDE